MSKEPIPQFNKTKVIDALPSITINMVLDLYHTTYEADRIRVTNDNYDRLVFEIRESNEDRVFNPDSKNAKSKEETGKKFNANGEFWKEFKMERSGTGGFNLLRFLEDLEGKDKFNEALYKIKEYFLNDNYELDEDKISNNRNSYTGNFSFRKGGNTNGSESGEFYDSPYVAFPEFLDEGLKYLNQERGIPIELLKRSTDYENGKIYVTKTFYGDKLIIFESEMSGEERSIYGDHKQTVKSSIKTLTNFEVGADENTLIYDTIIEDGEEFEVIKKNTGYYALTEGAIDALSYNALFPDRYVSSTNGCGNFAYQYMKATGYLDADNGISLRIAFDSDEAGDIASQKLFNALYLRMIFKHKFKDVLQEKYGDKWLEKLDSWMGNKINFRLDPIPHLMFFNNPFYQEYPVYKKVILDEEVDDGSFSFRKKHKTAFKMVDDETSFPLISFYVDNEISELLKIPKENNLKVNRDNFNKITGEVIVREKPIGEKDWNELLIKQGISYINEYSELYKKGFKDDNGNIVFPKIDDNKSVISFYRERNFKNVEGLSEYFENNFLGMQRGLNNQEPKTLLFSDQDMVNQYNESFDKRRKLFNFANKDENCARNTSQPYYNLSEGQSELRHKVALETSRSNLPQVNKNLEQNPNLSTQEVKKNQPLTVKKQNNGGAVNPFNVAKNKGYLKMATSFKKTEEKKNAELNAKANENINNENKHYLPISQNKKVYDEQANLQVQAQVQGQALNGSVKSNVPLEEVSTSVPVQKIENNETIPVEYYDDGYGDCGGYSDEDNDYINECYYSDNYNIVDKKIDEKLSQQNTISNEP